MSDNSKPGAWHCATCSNWFEVPPWTGSKKRDSGTAWPECCGVRCEWITSAERTGVREFSIPR